MQYGLFAREGFTLATREEAGRIGARLVDLVELERALVDAAGRAGLPLPDTEIEFQVEPQSGGRVQQGL